MSDALGTGRADDAGYTSSPLWHRSDDEDSIGENDFDGQGGGGGGGRHSRNENNSDTEVEESAAAVVSHYENYDTIGMSMQ